MGSILKESKGIKSFRAESKQAKKPIPEGAKILKKDVTVNVEEIENGFLISKSYDIKYQPKGSDHSDYTYYNEKFFSETNPLSIDTGDKSLADIFDNE